VENSERIIAFAPERDEKSFAEAAGKIEISLGLDYGREIKELVDRIIA
jgi:hypothetical protein